MKPEIIWPKLGDDGPGGKEIEIFYDRFDEVALMVAKNVLGCTIERSSIRTEIISATKRRRRMPKELSMAAGEIQPVGHVTILGKKE